MHSSYLGLSSSLPSPREVISYFHLKPPNCQKTCQHSPPARWANIVPDSLRVGHDEVPLLTPQRKKKIIPLTLLYLFGGGGGMIYGLITEQ